MLSLKTNEFHLTEEMVTTIFYFNLFNVTLDHIGCNLNESNWVEAVRTINLGYLYSTDGIDETNAVQVWFGRAEGNDPTRSDLGVQLEDSYFRIDRVTDIGTNNDAHKELKLEGQFSCHLFDIYGESSVPFEGEFALKAQLNLSN